MDLADVLPVAYLKQHSSCDLAFSQHSCLHLHTDCCTSSRLGTTYNLEAYSDPLFTEGNFDPLIEVAHDSYWTDNCSFVPFNLVAFLLVN